MPIRVARKRPDSYQHGDLRAALIQGGLKLLSDGGVPALTLRAAAQLAGVSHAAPYRHFRDKDALIAAIAEEGFRMLTAQMRREMDAAGAEPFARLRASAWGYVSFARAHPGYFRTMFGGRRGRGLRVAPAPASARPAWRPTACCATRSPMESPAVGCAGGPRGAVPGRLVDGPRPQPALRGRPAPRPRPQRRRRPRAGRKRRPSPRDRASRRLAPRVRPSSAAAGCAARCRSPAPGRGAPA